MNRLTLITLANSHQVPTVPPVEFDEITYVGVGAAASGSTSATPGYPAGIQNGDYLYLVCASKLQTAIVSTPSGWRRLPEGDIIVSTASNGDDLGPIRETVFMKVTDGTEAATETVTLTDGNSLNCAIYAFRPDPDAEVEIEVSGGAHNTPNLTAYEAISFHEMASEVGDIYFVATSVNTDLYAYNAQALSQTGNTFETINADTGEFSTTTGNDSEQFCSIFKVTAVGDPDPLKLTFTATSSGAAAGNPLGITIFIRMRQKVTAAELAPSGLRVWRASETVDTAYSGDGSAIWDGGRTSTEVTGTVSERYSIVTHNGRPCFQAHAELIDSSNYCRRAEVSFPVVWQQAFVIGTQTLFRIKYEIPLDAPDIYEELDIMQCHTGTAPGGPWPLNSPIFYLCFAKAGQAGWQNGTPTGGELGLVLSTTDPDIRLLIPGYEWEAGASIELLVHVKYGHSSDDTCLKLGARKNEGAFSWVYENYTDPTVFADGDIATHGAPANVGGVIKAFLYNHMITNGTAAAASVAAGNPGYKLLSPCIKMINQHPTDADYITDVTDNDNPIYDWVDTSNE